MNFKKLLEIVKNELKDLSSLENPDFRIEQAELNQELISWEIVVSYLVENTNPKSSPLAAITSEFKYLRIYKKIIIDRENNITGFYIYEQ
jgi:hypothetical protein